MNKWQYIRIISKTDDRYGGGLVKLMDYYNVISLRELTDKQVMDYYKMICEKEKEK